MPIQEKQGLHRDLAERLLSAKSGLVLVSGRMTRLGRPGRFRNSKVGANWPAPVAHLHHTSALEVISFAKCMRYDGYQPNQFPQAARRT